MRQRQLCTAEAHVTFFRSLLAASPERMREDTGVWMKMADLVEGYDLGCAHSPSKWTEPKIPKVSDDKIPDYKRSAWRAIDAQGPAAS